MTVSCHPDLQYLAQSASVESPTAFTVLGHRIDLSQQIDLGKAGLLPVLESELYRRLYCGAVESSAPPTEDPAEALAFIGALSQVNTGEGTWEPGWQVAPAGPGAAPEPGGTVAVTRDGVTFWAGPGQVRTASGTLSPGESCGVRISKEMRHLLSGFYMALGNLHPDGDGESAQPLLRLYWHLTPDGAIRYMQAATQRLNEAGIPFQTKVVANPRQYVRRDSGVLYLRQADFARVAPYVKAIYQTVGAGLLSDVPLFAKRLAPGLAVAEDPGGRVSFGQSRCTIAAQGLWQCHVQGLTEPEARLDAIAEAFRAGGIDPDHPYLEPGSVDHYEIDLESGKGGS